MNVLLLMILTLPNIACPTCREEEEKRPAVVLQEAADILVKNYKVWPGRPRGAVAQHGTAVPCHAMPCHAFLRPNKAILLPVCVHM